MGLKRKLNAYVKPVENTETDQQIKQENGVKKMFKNRELPTSEVLEVKDTEEAKKDGSDYATIEVKGSNGKTYRIVIPKSYYKLVPKTWSWNEKRYKVAEHIAAGFPMTDIAKICDIDRTAIYGWLQHPEFKEHVDGLILETGWANKHERIAGLNKLTSLLFKKVVNEIDQVKLTDKSIGAVLSSIQMIAKQLGIEKEELAEQLKVAQETTLSGAIGVASVDLSSILSNKTAEERIALEAEFNNIGNDIIRSITGEKD